MKEAAVGRSDERGDGTEEWKSPVRETALKNVGMQGQRLEGLFRRFLGTCIMYIHL